MKFCLKRGWPVIISGSERTVILKEKYMDNQTKSCDNCKLGLGGDMCRHNYELECRDDEYQLWEEKEE